MAKMNPDQYCWKKTTQSQSNFFYSFFALPKGKRRAIFALYAFCREVDDVVDNSKNSLVSEAKLRWWQKEISDMFDGNATHPVTRALEPFVFSLSLEQRYFQEIIEGMRMDLTTVRYRNFSDLSRYCYLVAGTVGILSATIFGYQSGDTKDFAKNLGLALQLTNIIRDVNEDAERGRIYLPLEEINKFNMTEKQILNGQLENEFQKLMSFQIERAESYYKLALANLPRSEYKNQRTSLIIAKIYMQLLSKLKNRKDWTSKSKVKLSIFEKIKIATLTWILN